MSICGTVCGERINVRERRPASEWKGVPFLPRDCQRQLPVAWVKYDIQTRYAGGFVKEGSESTRGLQIQGNTGKHTQSRN